MKLFKIKRNEKGQAMIEIALVAPILMMIFYVLFNFGLFFHDYLFYIQAFRDGARYGAINGSGVGAAAVQAQIVQYASNYGLYLISVAADDISVSWTSDSIIVSGANNAQLVNPFLDNLTIPISFTIEMPSE
ncbi:TadE/TadG family type IV pilus assembly protein [Candidatus Margulisiibacteriota bacterium]